MDEIFNELDRFSRKKAITVLRLKIRLITHFTEQQTRHTLYTGERSTFSPTLHVIHCLGKRNEKKETGGSITKNDNNVTKMEIKKERKKKDSETATENFNSSFSLFPLALRMYGCSKICKKYVTCVYEKRKKEKKELNEYEQFRTILGYLHVGIKRKKSSSFSAKGGNLRGKSREICKRLFRKKIFRVEAVDDRKVIV